MNSCISRTVLCYFHAAWSMRLGPHKAAIFVVILKAFRTLRIIEPQNLRPHMHIVAPQWLLRMQYKTGRQRRLVLIFE